MAAERIAREQAAEPDSLIPGIKQSVLVLGLVSFLTDISSEMVYPLVPLFLTSSLGAPAAAVGLIEGLAESSTAFLRAASGWLSDRVGARKPLVFAGYSLSSLGKLVLALSYIWPVVLLARTIDRAGKGIRTAPRDALIADVTPLAQRGRAFGFHRAADTAGAVLGPAFAIALLAATDNHYRLIFLLAVIPAVLGVSVIPLARERRASASRAVERVPLRSLGLTFYVFLAVSALFAFGNSSDVFLILRARDIGLRDTEVVLAYVGYNAVYSLLAMPAGIISDRIGRRKMISLGYAVFAIVYLGFGLNESQAFIWLLFGVYGLHMALMEGVSRAMVVDVIPAQGRATALGLYQGVLGGMVLLASVLAGLLWDNVGHSAPFILGAVTGASTLVMFLASVSFTAGRAPIKPA
ncbi:MAG TPA: MFS transporter [Dehalococcoidia bacterium]|nr:MFS transporter [Dehalococcoidia bacterium]